MRVRMKERVMREFIELNNPIARAAAKFLGKSVLKALLPGGVFNLAWEVSTEISKMFFINPDEYDRLEENAIATGRVEKVKFRFGGKKYEITEKIPFELI